MFFPTCIFLSSYPFTHPRPPPSHMRSRSSHTHVAAAAAAFLGARSRKEKEGKKPRRGRKKNTLTFFLRIRHLATRDLPHFDRVFVCSGETEGEAQNFEDILMYISGKFHLSSHIIITLGGGGGVTKLRIHTHRHSFFQRGRVWFGVILMESVEIIRCTKIVILSGPNLPIIFFYAI